MDILLQEIMLSIKAILGVIKSSTGQRRHGIVADSVYFSWKLLETSRIIWIHLKILDKKKLQKKLAKSCNGLPKYKPKSLYIQNYDNFFYPITFYLNIIATKPSAEF